MSAEVPQPQPQLDPTIANQQEVWSTTAYHGAPLEVAPLQDHPLAEAGITQLASVVDPEGNRERGWHVEGTKNVAGQEFTQLWKAGTEKTMTVATSELEKQNANFAAKRAAATPKIGSPLVHEVVDSVPVTPEPYPTLHPHELRELRASVQADDARKSAEAAAANARELERQISLSRAEAANRQAAGLPPRRIDI